MRRRAEFNVSWPGRRALGAGEKPRNPASVEEMKRFSSPVMNKLLLIRGIPLFCPGERRGKKTGSEIWFG